MGVGLLIYQITELFKIKDFKKRPTERMAPMFMVLGLFTNLMTAVGFGKPTTPFYISIAGLFLTALVCFICEGLWE